MASRLLFIFIIMPILLSSCGRKLKPKPPEGVTVTYPQIYPSASE